jgi:hypothetical protein
MFQFLLVYNSPMEENKNIFNLTSLVRKENENTFSNHLDNYIQQYNLNLSRTSPLSLRNQNNFISIAWYYYSVSN